MREYDYNLEILRAVCCVLVIVIHIGNMYCRSFADITPLSFSIAAGANAIARVSVPIFFMISGALLGGGNPNIRKSLHRTFRYALVLLIWTVLYALWNLHYYDRSYAVTEFLAEPSKAHLWFLYVIIGIYLVLPLIQSFLTHLDTRLALMFVGLWFLSVTIYFVFGDLHIDIKYEAPFLASSSYYLGYFALGYLIRRYLPQLPMEKWRKWAITGITISLVLTIAITIYLSLSEQRYNNSFLEYRSPLIVIASVSIFYLFSIRENKPLSHGAKPIALVADASFGIYLVHILFMNIVDGIIPIETIPVAVGLPGVTLLLLILSTGFVMGVKALKVDRFFL